MSTRKRKADPEEELQALPSDESEEEEESVFNLYSFPPITAQYSRVCYTYSVRKINSTNDYSAHEIPESLLLMPLDGARIDCDALGAE